ncbi:protein kinase domain-containing protein [Sorangium sp. So ce1000]|uniref:protein kinase domain-containing protein n=1 Tax=Sorangium sp. So ce1000 TaxID=3133325 RepID=UPI003F5F50F1
MDSAYAEGHVIADRYRVVRVLGRGGSAITYEAEDLSTGGRVAVKQLLIWKRAEWKALDLFEREARILASLTHPSIPRYIDYLKLDGAQGPCFYLVQELAPGRPLSAWVKEGWRADEAEASTLARHVLRTLLYLQGFSQPIVHRDIKPQNLLRHEDGSVYLVDFGAVAEARDTTSGGSTVVGTYGYMAPEQFRGRAVPGSDLYGLGATLLHVLSGRDPADLPQKGMRLDVRGSIQVSRPFADWLDRMLEPDLDRRFATAREALLALDRPAEGGPRRGLLAVAAVALGLTVAGGAAAVFLRARSVPIPAAAVGRAAPGAPTAPGVPAKAAANERAPLVPLLTLSGHWSAIFEVAYHPGGNRLASGSNDLALKLWNLDDGQPLRSFAGHTKRIGGIAFTPDGKTLVSAADTTVRLWDVDSGALLKTLDAGAGVITDLALSADGGRVAVSSMDGTVRVFSIRTGANERTFQNGGRVLSVAMTADGNEVLSGDDRGAVRIWSVETGREIGALSGHAGAVNRIVIGPDAQTVISASDDRTIRLFHLGSRKPLNTLSGHTDEVWSLALSPNGDTLVSGGKDDRIRVWDVYSGKLRREQRAGLNGVIALAFHPGGAQFAAGGGNNQIRIWAVPGKVWRPPVPPADYTPEPVVPEPAPSEEASLVRDANALLDEGRSQTVYQRARQLLEQALRTNPTYAPAHAALGRVAYKSGYLRGDEYEPDSLARAHEHTDKALELDPKCLDAHVVKGWTYIFQKNYGDARRRAEAAEALRPDADDVMLLSATLAEREGKTEDALERAKRLIETSKNPLVLARAYDVLTDVYKAMREWDAVEDTYLAIVRLDPKSAWAKGNYAAFLTRREEHDRAVDMARAALATSDYPIGRMILASALCGKGRQLLARQDLEGARAQFLAAREAYPASADVQHGLALYLRALAEKEQEPQRRAELLAEAKKHLDEALRLDPKHRGAKEALAAHDRPAR